MKRFLILILMFIFTLSIGITYSLFKTNKNITGSIKVYSYDFCKENGYTKLSDCMLVMENYSPSINEAKNYISSKGNISYKKTAPLITYVEKKEDAHDNNGLITTTAHFTFGKGYKFDSEKGMFELTDYVNDELSDKYIGYYTCGGSTETLYKCSRMFQIYEYDIVVGQVTTTSRITKGVKHTYTTSDSFDSEIGLYPMIDNDGTSYFYRGNVQNNYVSFAGYIWRIVRRNGDGTVRLIYSGTSSEDTGQKVTIAQSVYNDKHHMPAYSGYKYGETFELIVDETNVTYKNLAENTLYYYGSEYIFDEETKKFYISGNTKQSAWKDNYEDTINNYPYTCFATKKDAPCNYIAKLKKYENNTSAVANFISYSSKSYSSTLENTTDSTIKGVVDKWYEDNLLNKTDNNGNKYSSYIADTTFCSDRTIYNGDGYSMSKATTFNSFARVAHEKTIPTLSCYQPSDIFKVSNGNLKYPIALLTADEAALAGGVHISANTKYYLYTGDTYWTMTPEIYTPGYATTRVSFVDVNGGIDGRWVAGVRSVRPVINIKADVQIISGTGTKDNPYKIT